MKVSIRNKLTWLILAICLSIIAFTCIVPVVFFKPLYYTMTQVELTSVLSKTIRTISDNDGQLDSSVIEDITSYVRSGYCIEIADEFGNGLVLMEGVGDGCQLHGESEVGTGYSLYADQRRLNTQAAVELRQLVRNSKTFLGSFTDNYGNRQPVQGKYWNNKYTIIASTSLAQTDTVARVVYSQLRTVIFFSIIMALVISALMSNWFIKPLVQLSKATKQIASGHYDVQIEVPEGPTDEIGQLAEDFKSMAKEIENSQEMQKELISGITHDLRTPLTIIKGYAESIRDITGKNEEIRNQQLNTIIDETDRLSKMVNSVLEYSKLTQGGYKLNVVQYNMADMCLDIVDIYSDKAQKEGKSITYEGPDTAYVMADAQLIERVMHNYVSNALLHTPENTNVTVKMSLLENGKVKISVIDSGAGISEEDQKHIFERYYRSRKADGKQGTGLGLAVVKTIMENHNFEYGVNSELGKGSEFWFIM